jgi:Flp pilus assembly protein TadD
MEASSLKSRTGFGRVSVLRRGACVGMCLALMGASTLWSETCTPPAEMKSKLQSKPTAEVYNDLGVWYAGQQQYACAVEAFATSLQMEPTQKDLAHVAFMFGVSLYFSGDTKEAVASLQEAEKLGFRDIKIHLILGTALDSLHSTADAESEWRAALMLDPESTSALDGLSSDLIGDNNFAETIMLLESPRLVPQRTVQQSVNLGLAYAKMAKPEEAVTVLQDGLNTTPDSLDVANLLADVLMQLNRKAEAVMILKLALAQHPDDPEVKQNLTKALESLGTGKQG